MIRSCVCLHHPRPEDKDLRRKKSAVIKLIVFLGCIACLGFLVYHYFFDLNAVQPGKYISESVSPSGKYTVTAYLYQGSATTDHAVLCVLSHGNTKKNIYWQYHCGSAEIIWVDDNTVEINGIRLEDVEKDTYDWRRR